MSPATDACPKFDVLRRQLELVDAGAKFFSDLFDRAPEAMVVIDSKGRVLAANAAACRLYAVDQSELVRMRVQDLLPRELDLTEASRRLRDYGEVSLEFTETTKDGSTNHMRLEGRLFQAGRYLVSFRDVTREKRFERELERAHEQRTFGEAAAAIVHDVNNLLVPILCYADLLAMRDPAEDDLLGNVAEIRDAAERAASLARKLLSIAELNAEKPVPLDINSVVGRLSGMLQRLLGEGIDLSLRLEDELGVVIIDAERLERLILNIVLNARDAMPNGGKVFIETSHVLRAHRCSNEPNGAPKRYVTLSISDNGTGMDRATRERIFEPFFTTKSKSGGTGLGLSTALAFVQRNHGYIDVETEPGCGTTFRIGLPEIIDRPSTAIVRAG
ncbi:MAG: ATP-binding protein [Polyangiaceae bacterium]